MTKAEYEHHLWKQGNHTLPDVIGVAAQREKDLHLEILNYVRSKGWYCVHSRCDQPTTNAVGLPDFVIAKENGQTLWIECKSKTGKLSLEQQATARWLQKLGHKVHLCRCFDDFLSVLAL